MGQSQILPIEKTQEEDDEFFDAKDEWPSVEQATPDITDLSMSSGQLPKITPWDSTTTSPTRTFEPTATFELSEKDRNELEKLIIRLIELVILPHIVLMSKEPQSVYSKFLDKYKLYGELRDNHIKELESKHDNPRIKDDPIWSNEIARKDIINSYKEATDIDNSQILQYFYKKILDKEYQIDE